MSIDHIGETIRALRTEKGMTQKELAAAIGVTDKAVSKWETGRSFPDIALLDSLAGTLGCPISELLGSSGLPDEHAMAEQKLRDRITEDEKVRARAKMLMASAVWIAAPLLLFLAADDQLEGQPVFFFVLGVIFFTLFGIRFGLRCRKTRTLIIIAVVLMAIEQLVMLLAYQINTPWFDNYFVPPIFRKFYGGIFFGVLFRAAQARLSLETYYWQFHGVCLKCAQTSAMLMFVLILAGAAIGQILQKRMQKDHY